MNAPLEYGIVGALVGEFSPREKILGLIALHGLRSSHFTDNTMRTVFETVLANPTDDKAVLLDKLRRKTGNGWLEEAISSAGVSLPDTEGQIRRLAMQGLATEARAAVDRNIRDYGEKSSPEFFLDAICRDLKGLHAPSAALTDDGGVSIADIADPGPLDEHPDALLKGGYLRRGHALVLASVTGSGKSVISIQMAYAFAAGRPCLGLEPVRPMKIGIFQTEDDEVEVAEFRSSMRRGYREVYGWSDAEIRAAEKEIVFLKTNFASGAAFADLVRKVQLRRRFDLVIVNPLQAVCGCNLSDNTEMREFLVDRLDPVIKGEETKCALLIVHHTNKPVMAAGRPGFGGDEYAEYLGAGAGTLANWMRAMLAVMPDRETGGFRLIGAKRGKRLGWPKIEGRDFAKPTKLIRHSTPEEGMLFWREIDANALPDVVEKEGAPTLAQDAAKLAVALKQVARTLTEARAFAKQLLGRKRGEAAYEEITAKTASYDLVIMPTGKANQTIIGSQEGVEKYFSTLSEKLLQEQQAKLAKMRDRR